jgi:hypothetical protein
MEAAGTRQGPDLPPEGCRGMDETHTMAEKTDCGVCGRPLVYGVETVTLICALCGREESSLIRCPAGHFVCDDCHGKPALDVLADVLRQCNSTDPGAILERAMAHPSVTMHGPEHHAIVPAVLVAAVTNAGYPVPDGALDRAVERGRRVPGGWCGSHGSCGAAIGVGIAVSVLTEATPLKGEERTLSLAATAAALTRMLDDGPRCCKRASRVAVESAVEFLRDRLAVSLPTEAVRSCAYTRRNAQCPGRSCPYH